MKREKQRITGVWIMLVLSFLVMGGFLYFRNQPMLRFAALYWFPITIMTVTGILPPPWKILENEVL